MTSIAGLPVLLACLLGGLPACNTIEGAGEDIEETREAIDDAAEDAG